MNREDKRESKAVFFNAKPGRTVCGLLASVPLASRIAKTARAYQLTVYNGDRADSLVRNAREKKPMIVILDWDDCEAEAFKVLKELALDADLQRVPVVGYLSNEKVELKSVAERSGCDRVYFKSEFFRELDNILIRYSR